MPKHWIAILPNSGKQEIPAEKYQLASSIGEAEKTSPPYERLQQPKPITIQQYRERQQRLAEESLVRIPQTEKPKHRRGGRIVKLRRRLAALKALVNSENPPPWNIANKSWQEISEIETELHRRKKTNQKQHNHNHCKHE